MGQRLEQERPKENQERWLREKHDRDLRLEKQSKILTGDRREEVEPLIPPPPSPLSHPQSRKPVPVSPPSLSRAKWLSVKKEEHAGKRGRKQRGEKRMTKAEAQAVLKRDKSRSKKKEKQARRRANFLHPSESTLARLAAEKERQEAAKRQKVARLEQEAERRAGEKAIRREQEKREQARLRRKRTKALGRQ